MPLRFDPFRELDRLASVTLGTSGEGMAHAGVPMDIVRSADDVRVYFDLPGVDPDTVDLTIERNRLTLRATRRFELAEGARMVVRERPSGDFQRTLVLSEGLDGSRVSARFDHGVLEVTIPVAELAQPRRVQIGSTVRATTQTAEPAIEVGVPDAGAAQEAPSEPHQVSVN